MRSSSAPDCCNSSKPSRASVSPPKPPLSCVASARRSTPRIPHSPEHNPMSWLEKLLPPKIQPTDPAERRSVPEGLWVKCPSCETVLYKTDLEQNLNVCPTCSHHHRISGRARLNTFLDAEGRWE